MSTFEIIMPKMGESVEEATITKWFVKVGDKVVEDDVLLEIATDKVDSEIPSPVAGVIKEIKYEVDALVPVGKVVAIIALEGGADVAVETPKTEVASPVAQSAAVVAEQAPAIITTADVEATRFYSPLVKNIAKEEGISIAELETLTGSGKDGRVTKEDILAYVSQRKDVVSTASKPAPSCATKSVAPEKPAAAESAPKASVSIGAADTIVEMDRMRKIIADHMVMSKRVSPHVTSMVEADMTNIVLWRNKNKEAFAKKYGENLTFTPIFFEAVAKALRDFPGVNASVDGDKIIYRKNVNVGMAAALPTGNLIVPVIKNADQKNLAGMASDVNRLANLARANKLTADDISGGTFTVSNFGSFKNLMGTPIINQPQVAILAIGSIEKKPAVIETPTGDVIAIRHKMFLSLSYDHRVVDGMLGGSFLRRIADYLEEFSLDREV